MVPYDLVKHENQRKQRITVTTYSEKVNSKIYTEVRDNLMVLVLKGKKKLQYKNFQTTIKEGQFAIFKKGNYIMNQILSDGAYESMLVFFDDALLRRVKGCNMNAVNGSVEFFQGEIVPYMMREAVGMASLAMSQEAYENILELKTLELLEYVRMNDRSGAFSQFINGCVRESDFKECVEKYYDTTKDIEELSERLNMSISSFKRRFQKEYDCSPHKWINEKKLQKACFLLDTTDYSVTDIGFICGYESMSTFMNAFKVRYGTSPGKYREN